MTIKDAAEKLSISVRLVQNRYKSGQIKGLQRIGTNYLIPKDVIKPPYVYIHDTHEADKSVL